MAARDLIGSCLLLAALTACGEEPVLEEDSDSNAHPSLVRVDARLPDEMAGEEGNVLRKDGAIVPDGGSPVQEDAAVADAARDADVPSEPSNARVIPPDAQVADASTPCKTKFYVDADSDGFGNSTSFVFSCAAPSGYVEDNSDCYDKNASAKPGQSGRFNTHRGDGSFDYDCDGVEKPMSSKVASCPDLSTAVCSPSFTKLPLGVIGAAWCDYDDQVSSWQIPLRGWYGKLPACGQPGLQNMAVVWNTGSNLFACVAPPASASRIQACN